MKAIHHTLPSPYWLIFLITLVACGDRNKEKASEDPLEVEQYMASIEDWRSLRLNSLTSDHGWLTLAGLYWLADGENTFGTNVTNDILFPENGPEYGGAYILALDKVMARVEDDRIRINDTLLTASKIFEVKTDQDEEPTEFSYGTLEWYIIKRGEKYGIRLRDFQSKKRKTFKGIDSYAIDPQWRVRARVIPYKEEHIMDIDNEVGMKIPMTIPARLTFTIQGEKYSIEALEGSPDQFFLIFADATSAEETYGSGRYIYVDKPVAGKDSTWIDFNKAYNPPCAFTDYATCLLAPKENYLPIRVEAGEKY